jgi:hypothetical protein
MSILSSLRKNQTGLFMRNLSMLVEDTLLLCCLIFAVNELYPCVITIPTSRQQVCWKQVLHIGGPCLQRLFEPVKVAKPLGFFDREYIADVRAP